MAKGFIRNVAFPVIALGHEGYALGPDLVTVKTRGKKNCSSTSLIPIAKSGPNSQAYIIRNERR